MFPLILTVLKRDYRDLNPFYQQSFRGIKGIRMGVVTIMSCEYKGEHP